MTFAKLPGQPPQFDAGAFAKHAGITAADVKNFQAWKQWVGGELAYDGPGLRDVVNANGLFLTAVKSSLDDLHTAYIDVVRRLTALEDRPQTPFPGSIPQ